MRELAAEAYRSVDPGPDPYNEAEAAWVGFGALERKFAELVWKAAYEEGHDAGVDAGFKAGRNASFTEHNFGVEE